MKMMIFKERSRYGDSWRFQKNYFTKQTKYKHFPQFFGLCFLGFGKMIDSISFSNDQLNFV